MGLSARLKRLWSELLDIIFPSCYTCLFCEHELLEHEAELCDACKEQLKPAPERIAPEGLDGIRSAFVYDATSRLPIHRLKYDHQPYLGERLGSYITVPSEWNADALVPVPLNRKRYIKRGYNQSELIARGISKQSGLPLDTKLLRRTRNTPAQANLNAVERRKNLTNAFRANGNLDGRRLILVDDVVTTGETLSACARALREAGAEAIYALTVADANR